MAKDLDLREAVARLAATKRGGRRLSEGELRRAIRELQRGQESALVDYAHEVLEKPPGKGTLKEKILHAIECLERDLGVDPGGESDNDDDDASGSGESDRGGGESDDGYDSGEDSDGDSSGGEGRASRLLRSLNSAIRRERRRGLPEDIDDDEPAAGGYDSSDLDGEGRKKRREARRLRRDPEKCKRKLRRIMKKARRRIPKQYILAAYGVARIAARANSSAGADDIILQRGITLDIKGVALELWMNLVLRMVATMRKYC